VSHIVKATAGQISKRIQKINQSAKKIKTLFFLPACSLQVGCTMSIYTECIIPYLFVEPAIEMGPDPQ